ncbi:MAG: acetyl-CoA acetyltransferase [Acidobacteria bacterium]|nr:acetyl-CoA acetyltransferase [Acidobacteriota bacterium]
MPNRVAIIGVGCTPAQPTTPYLSFKELMFQEAERAYLDAGIEASEVESFVTCAEDLNEGLSIFDEYTPDQLGAVQKPMHTLTQDGLHGIADAVMQIQSGLVELVVVEAHSKASNILTPEWILDYAVDPVWNRPLGFNPHAIAGLEMNVFLHETGITPDQCAHVTAKNRTNALRNPLAAYPARTAPGDVADSPYAFYPLRETEMARTADGCVVVVLASDDRARAGKSQPVWVRGVGFANDSSTLESRDWIRAEYCRVAAQMAYRQAGIHNPGRDIHLFEVDDTYAYKELQHLVALGLYSRPGDAGRAVASGVTKPNGETPVNVSGGALGMGLTLEATGLYRVAELVAQLRKQAGARQLPHAKVALAQSWRGVPTTSGAVVVLSSE